MIKLWFKYFCRKGQSFFRLSMGFKIIFLQGVIHFLPELKSCLILRLFSTGVSTGADLALRQGCLKWIAASYSSRVLYKIKEIQETKKFVLLEDVLFILDTLLYL